MSIRPGTRVAATRGGRQHIARDHTRTGAVACLCGAVLTSVRSDGLTGPECDRCVPPRQLVDGPGTSPLVPGPSTSFLCERGHVTPIEQVKQRDRDAPVVACPHLIGIRMECGAIARRTPTAATPQGGENQ